MDQETSSNTSSLRACWSQVGIWGNRSCPELQQHVHCRNCPAYAEAAALMLDGPVPEGYVEAWTDYFAQAHHELPRDTHSLLVFRIKSEWFGLSVSVLVEVMERRPLHSLPQARSPLIKGIVNVRGQLLLCVSLARLLQVSTAESESTARRPKTTFARLLVVRTESGPLVFPVSEVCGLWRYREADLRAVPSTVARSSGRFTRSVLPWKAGADSRRHAPAGQLIGVLDEQRLFHAVNRSLT